MATYYWVGGSGTWDNVTTTNWAASSGGAGGAGVPNNTDTVNFDANSGTAATVTVEATAACLNCTINKSDINLSLSGSPTFSGLITLTTGTISLGNNTLTCARFLSNFTTGRTIAFGTGKFVCTGGGSAGVIVWDAKDIANLTISGTATADFTYSGSTGSRVIYHASTAGGTQAKALNATIINGGDAVSDGSGTQYGNLVFSGYTGAFGGGASSRTIYGNLTLSTGMTVTSGANATTFASASGTQTITSDGTTFSAPINIGSATAFPTVELADALNLGARAIGVTAGTFDTKGYNVTCSNLQTFGTDAYTKAIKLNNSTVTLAGNIIFIYPNNFTFDAGTSSIVFTGAAAGFLLYYNSDYTFYNVSFTNSAMTQSNLESRTITFNNLSYPNATTTSYYVQLSANIVVNGTLTLPTGSSYINRTGFYSLEGSTINAAAISGTLTDVDFRGITVIGPTAPWTGTRLGDGGGNSGITGFEAPKTVYWSLAAGGNWSATAWATSSGGTPAVANYPILGDTVIFDNAGLNTSATVTVDRVFAINNLDFSARSNAMTLAGAAGQRFVNGNFTTSSGITFSATFTLNIGPWSGTSTFTSAGRTISFFIFVMTGPSGNVVFADNVTSTSTFNPIAGNVDLNGKTFSFTQIQPARSIISVINLNGATITCTAATPLSLVASGGTAGYKTFIGTCTFNCSSASTKTINNAAMVDLSGFTFVNTGAGALTFSNTVTPGFNDGQYGTYGDIQTTVRPATINFTAGQTFQFNNFTISGTSGNLVTLQSSTAGTQATLLSPNTVNSVSFCSIKDLNAINTMGYGEWRAYTTNGNVDAGNNTGWLFSPATPSTAPRPTIRLRSLAQRGNMT